MRYLNISDDIIKHSIRTLRSFLESVINDAFGNPISIQQSFGISLK